MRQNRGLTAIEILVVIVCLLVVAGVLLQLRERSRNAERRTWCKANLGQIAKAMNMYLLKYGNNYMFAIPAQSFRGDCWLAELYWSGIIREPKVFLCMNTNDTGTIPAGRPANLALGSAIAPDAISYAGLCKGLPPCFAHRNTRWFTEDRIGSASALACDDNEGTQNHPDGMNVVYFDSHVEFVPGDRAKTYDLIGAQHGQYVHLDSGEE